MTQHTQFCKCGFLIKGLDFKTAGNTKFFYCSKCNVYYNQQLEIISQSEFHKLCNISENRYLLEVKGITKIPLSSDVRENVNKLIETYAPELAKEIQYDDKIHRKCHVPTKCGICVQSEGERLIADWLYEHGILFEYDKRLRGSDEFDDKEYIIGRPDFRLKNKDVVIEYWGMINNREGNPDYMKKKKRKIQLYTQEGFKLIEVFQEQLGVLDSYLRTSFQELGIFVK